MEVDNVVEMEDKEEKKEEMKIIEMKEKGGKEDMVEVLY